MCFQQSKGVLQSTAHLDVIPFVYLFGAHKVHREHSGNIG